MVDPDVPAILSHYEVQESLGRGGMGAVYRGQDRRDGSPVAIKVMHPHLAADETFRERFTREAHVAALLRSPYTVHQLDYGFAGEHLFLVMEFIEGETLRAELRRGPMDPQRALRIAIQVSRALEEAEARGVVHRDIKPENILLSTNDHVKVADFGIARQVESAGLTAVGGFVGTPAYAAPEQLRGESDHRSDIYALGAVLYESLTGRPPSASRGETLALPGFAALPAAVSMTVQRCLAEDAGERFARATELTGALERVLQAIRDGTAETVPADIAPTEAAVPASTAAETRIAGNSVSTPATLNVRLGIDRRGMLGGRMGATSYLLSIENPTDEPVNVRLSATDDNGALSVDLPSALSLGPRTTESLPVHARRRQTRWFGSRQQRRFTVSAAMDGGQPPAVVRAAYDDVPFGIVPVGGGVFAVVLVALFATFFATGSGESGADEQTQTPSPTVDITFVEDLLAPSSLFDAIVEATGLPESDILDAWDADLTLQEALDEAGVDTRETADLAVQSLVERFDAEQDTDDDVTLETIREQSSAAVATFIETPRSRFDGGPTPIIPTPAPTSAAPTPTTPAAPPERIAQGDWTYVFGVVENTCGEGLTVGEVVTVSFSLSVAGRTDGFIEPGDTVSVFESTTGTFLGDFVFTYPGWDISYPLAAGFFPDTGTFYSGGTGFLFNEYFGETSGTSALDEVYELGSGTCRISFEE